MNKHRQELSPTEALVRQGLRPAHFRTADEPPHSAMGSADLAVAGHLPGRFRRETGAGNESMGLACKVAGGCNE